jgi:hypothetical protein
MALYGEARDISFFRSINRELIGNIISQECIYYKYVLSKTKTNMYGEAAHGKFFEPPVILPCLIQTGDQGAPVSDFGVEATWPITFKFLTDDLLSPTPCEPCDENDNPHSANIVPQIGDIIFYQNGYWEVDNTEADQFFTGKNPAYPFKDSLGNNPLEDDLQLFGYAVSIIVTCHMVPADRLNIQRTRL